MMGPMQTEAWEQQMAEGADGDTLNDAPSMGGLEDTVLEAYAALCLAPQQTDVQGDGTGGLLLRLHFSTAEESQRARNALRLLEEAARRLGGG